MKREETEVQEEWLWKCTLKEREVEDDRRRDGCRLLKEIQGLLLCGWG